MNGEGKKLGLVGKVILGVGVVASLFSGKTEANTLSSVLECNNPIIQTSSVQLSHHSQPELFNMPFMYGHSPAMNIFYLDGTTEMKGIGKPADSMETETTYISGVGLSESTNALLNFNISEASFYGEYPENNFTDKNIFADLYTSTGSLVGTFNVKDYAANGWTIPLTISNGLSYTMDIRFEPNTFELKDLANFAEHWLQQCNVDNNKCDGLGEDGEYLNFIDFAYWANKWNPNN